MKREGILALLEEPIAQQQPVALYRNKLDVPPLYCVPLASSERLLLVALYADFQPDGYEVVRLRDLSGVQSDERTAFHARIMAKEGVLPELAVPPVPLGDFAALLTTLGERQEPVIVEDGSKTFLLGTIEKTGKNKLRVRYIGTDGQVDPKISRISYKQIASVHFGGRYLNLVARYAAPVEPPAEPPAAPPAQAGTSPAKKPARKKKIGTEIGEAPAKKPVKAAGARKPARKPAIIKTATKQKAAPLTQDG